MIIRTKYGVGDRVTDGSSTGTVAVVSFMWTEYGKELKYLVQKDGVRYRETWREESMELLSRAPRKRVRANGN